MKPRINFITIAVADLKRSIGFYRDFLGLPTKGLQEGYEEHCLFDLENDFNLVLYRRSDFLPLTGNPDPKEISSGFIISHNTDTREEVDIILQKALEGGGKQVGPIHDESWGYSVSFADPDGHQWEIVYMPAYSE